MIGVPEDKVTSDEFLSTSLTQNTFSCAVVMGPCGINHIALGSSASSCVALGNLPSLSPVSSPIKER